MRLLFISADDPATSRDGYGIYSRHIMSLADPAQSSWSAVFGRGHAGHEPGLALAGLRRWPRCAQALAVASGRSATRNQFRHRQVTRWALALIRRHEPDVVILNHIRAGWLLPALESRTPSALVYIAHNDEARALASAAPHMDNAAFRAAARQEAQATQRLQGRILGAAGGLITISDVDADHLARHHHAALPVVTIAPPRPVLVPVTATTTPDRLLFVGSVSWEPKFQNLVWLLRQVIPRILTEHPTATFDIVGTGVHRIEPHARDRRIRVHSDVDDVAPHLKAGGIFLIPERQQGGVKLKAIEAAAHAFPIVSTPEGVEGTPLAHPDSCLVATSEAGFASAIHSLIVDSVMASKLGLRAQQAVASMPSATNQRATLTLFLSAVGLQGPRTTDG